MKKLGKVIGVTLVIVGLLGFIAFEVFSKRYNEADLYDNLVSDNNTYGDFSYDEYDEHVIITTYNGSDAEVEIPEEIDGKTVLSIADSAFYGNTDLKVIRFNEGLLRIGHQTFIGCSELEYIYIPDSVVDIGEATFWGCSSIKKIYACDRILKEIEGNKE